jgi:long-chain acyl-CoA synthetase
MSSSLESLLLDHPLPGDAPLVHFGGRHWTVAEVQEGARSFAATLQDAGLAPGQPVAALVTSGPDALAVMFGCWIAGSPCLPLNARLSDRELLQMLETTPPALLVQAVGRPRLEGIACGSLIPDGDLRWRVEGAALTVETHYTEGAALVLRTSGTTGPPKAIVHTHKTMLDSLDTVIGSIRAVRKEPRTIRSEALVNVIPVSLALTAGIYNTLFAFRVGASVVLIERFSTTEFAEAVRRFRIRSTVLAPAMISMLASDETISDLSPLRTVRSITAPLVPSEARRFHERFGAVVLNSYGQTELGGEVVGWSVKDWRKFSKVKLGSVGRPHEGVDVQIRDDDGVPQPPGTTGHIYVRSPFLTSGYSDDGALEARIQDGYVRTGDLGHFDEDGFLWIDGRESDMINRGGLKVMPDEVEDVLLQHPNVREACVAGVPDQRLGEVPFAWVVLTEPVDAAALEAWCRERLSPYKVPVGFRAVEALPRSEVGKVLRKQLVATFA